MGIGTWDLGVVSSLSSRSFPSQGCSRRRASSSFAISLSSSGRATCRCVMRSSAAKARGGIRTSRAGSRRSPTRSTSADAGHDGDPLPPSDVVAFTLDALPRRWRRSGCSYRAGGPEIRRGLGRLRLRAVGPRLSQRAKPVVVVADALSLSPWRREAGGGGAVPFSCRSFTACRVCAVSRDGSRREWCRAASTEPRSFRLPPRASLRRTGRRTIEARRMSRRACRPRRPSSCPRNGCHPRRAARLATRALVAQPVALWQTVRQGSTNHASLADLPWIRGDPAAIRSSPTRLRRPCCCWRDGPTARVRRNAFWLAIALVFLIAALGGYAPLYLVGARCVPLAYFRFP